MTIGRHSAASQLVEYFVSRSGWKWILLLFLVTFMARHNGHLRIETVEARVNLRDIKHGNNAQSMQETATRSTRSGRPNCSLTQFRNYYSRHHEFPGNGTWVERGDHTDFEAEMCQLHGQPVQEQFLSECLRSSKISSMLLLGDSNVDKYFTSLLSILNNVSERMAGPGKACDIGRSELHLPKQINGTFYRSGRWGVDKLLQVSERFCGQCGGREFRCRYTVGHGRQVSVDVSRIPLTSIIDASISIRTPGDLRGLDYVHWAPTTQEYLFQYYLHNKYPDIIVFFLPFSHTKNVLSTISRARADLQYFHYFAKTYLPKTSKLFYMTGPAEHDRAKPDHWKGRLFQGMLANEKIEKLNRMLYRVLENDLLDPESNVIGFFDLMKLGRTRSSWSEDGVHMSRVWYSAIVTYLLELICNS